MRHNPPKQISGGTRRATKTVYLAVYFDDRDGDESYLTYVGGDWGPEWGWRDDREEAEEFASIAELRAALGNSGLTSRPLHTCVKAQRVDIEIRETLHQPQHLK